MYDGNVILWDLASGRSLRVILLDDPTDVARMFFAPDGKTLATVTAFSNLLRVFDVASGRALMSPIRLQESINAATAAFSPKGDLLATLVDGAVVVHRWSPQHWIEAVCRAVNRNLSFDEWADHVGPAKYQPPCPDLPLPRRDGAPANQPGPR